MATRLNGETLRWLAALHNEGSFAEESDGQLLDRFLTRTGPAREVAFEVLVRRHGQVVMRLCRRVLDDEHAAADAFQATFVVLARRASTIRNRDHIAPWLGRVARRIARASRKELARREARERPMTANAAETSPAVVDWDRLETASLVNAEVQQLPEADRLLLQLTYWQGKTYEEAAAQLAWPIGTLRSRLSRVRERLRARFVRRGLAPVLAVTRSTVRVKNISAAPPADALIVQTVRAASRSTEGIAAAIKSGAIPATLAELISREVSRMSILSWKSIAAVMLLGGTVATGVEALAWRASESGSPEPVIRVVGPEPAPPSAPPVVQKEAESKLMLTNPSIEEGKGDSPNDWTAGASIPGVEYIWSREGHTGKGSLCLKKTAKRYFPIAQWFQKADHKGDGTRLKVSAWVKADQVTKTILDAQFLDSKGSWTHAWVAYIGPKETGIPPFSHDWKRYEGIVTIPPDTREIIIAPQIYGPGTVWFDDLGAEYTRDPPTDPIKS